MKTEIVINDKNLSRYNKRMQKTLEENLGYKIKLSEASELFAQVLGMTTHHELKTVLEKDLTEDFKKKLSKTGLSTMDKLVIVLTQVQKMLRLTKAEYWYVPFCENGADYNPYYGKPEYSGFDALCTFTGFREFVYDPYPYEQTEEDRFFGCFLDEGLSMECIEYGKIDEDIDYVKSQKEDFYDEDDEFYKPFQVKRELYASKKEVKLLKEMLDFAETMLPQIVNLMKSYNDFYLVQKDKIIILLDGNIKEIHS